jgi:hypothetical protein
MLRAGANVINVEVSTFLLSVSEEVVWQRVPAICGSFYGRTVYLVKLDSKDF